MEKNEAPDSAGYERAASELHAAIKQLRMAGVAEEDIVEAARMVAAAEAIREYGWKGATSGFWSTLAAMYWKGRGIRARVAAL